MLHIQDERQREIRWQQLPEMNSGRYQFNPVLFKHLIYLCGGPESTSIDVFNPVTREMTESPVSLPEASACVALVEVNRLVVISKTKITKFVIGVKGGLSKGSSGEKGEEFDPYSQVTPVVFGDLVYIIQNVLDDMTCIQLEITTGKKSTR